MGVEHLRIRGYRSLADVTWEPGPLNVLIGINGSGKSNILRALMLLVNSANGRLAKSIRREGGMVPILWDGRVEEISWQLRVSSEERGELFEYELQLDQIGRGGSAYEIASEKLSVTYTDDVPGEGEQISVLERTPRRAWIRDVGLSGPTRDIESDQVSAEETLLSQVAAPFAHSTVARFRQTLSDWRVYHDVRVDVQSEMRRAAVTRLERRVDPDGQNLVPVLHTFYSSDRTFKGEINDAMRAAFGPEFEELTFPPAEDGRIQLRVRWRSLKRTQSAADLSDGALRFLFLITVLASPDPPPLIAIDEPELGLHPSMLPIVAEFAVEAATRTQVIMTTHSPEFLSAFSETPEATTIVEWRDGKTELRRVSGEKLSRWLERYRLGELWLSGELEGLG